MINNTVDLKSILEDLNYVEGRVPNATDFKGENLVFSLTQFSGSMEIEKRTTLFVMALDDKYPEYVINALHEAGLDISIDWTGFKEKYSTYEIKFVKEVGQGKDGVLW